MGEGVEQSIHSGGNKQDESRWKIFGKMGNTEGIIHKWGEGGGWVNSLKKEIYEKNIFSDNNVELSSKSLSKIIYADVQKLM